MLCDTNGGALPDEVYRVVSEVARHIPGSHLGIHAHNDTENAVANSLAAVEAGARQVQGTINGLGERCGNANLISLIPTLALKTDYETGIAPAQLERLTSVSHMLDELLNRSPDRSQAYVGEGAFSHKGGLHVSAVQKDPRTYEHIDPALVGNRRHIVVSDQAGRSNVLARLADAGIEIAADNPKIGRLVEDVKAREHDGYAYDGAEASFELLARKLLQGLPKFFTMESFRVETERRYNARGSLTTVSTAMTKLDVAGEALSGSGRGQRAGRRAGRRHAQGAAARLSGTGRHAPDRLQGPHPDAAGRHRRGHAGDDRIDRRQRPALVDRRDFGEHHRSLLRGAARRDLLEAAAPRRQPQREWPALTPLTDGIRRPLR